MSDSAEDDWFCSPQILTFKTLSEHIERSAENEQHVQCQNFFIDEFNNEPVMWNTLDWAQSWVRKPSDQEALVLVSHFVP